MKMQSMRTGVHFEADRRFVDDGVVHPSPPTSALKKRLLANGTVVRSLEMDGALHSGGPSTGKELWTTDVENAFQEAIRMYPAKSKAQSKQKILCKDSKMYGRNEMIGAYIQKMTGEIRNRKQISSHLQVLAKHAARFGVGRYGELLPQGPPLPDRDEPQRPPQPHFGDEHEPVASAKPSTWPSTAADTTSSSSSEHERGYAPEDTYVRDDRDDTRSEQQQQQQQQQPSVLTSQMERGGNSGSTDNQIVGKYTSDGRLTVEWPAPALRMPAAYAAAARAATATAAAADVATSAAATPTTAAATKTTRAANNFIGNVATGAAKDVGAASIKVEQHSTSANVTVSAGADDLVSASTLVSDCGGGANGSGVGGGKKSSATVKNGDVVRWSSPIQPFSPASSRFDASVPPLLASNTRVQGAAAVPAAAVFALHKQHRANGPTSHSANGRGHASVLPAVPAMRTAPSEASNILILE
jgi:hypothetical protein